MPKIARGASERIVVAVDLGAESGRVITGRLQNGALETEELHRFANEPVEYGGSLHWDTPRLWMEIRRGIEQAGDLPVESIGVDTWGVDYALLGERGELLENPFHYRDGRTSDAIEAICNLVPREEIYSATGIQFMPINTLCQLYAASQRSPRLLRLASHFLTMPDLFHYWLTGNAVCEYTNATTTQMVNPRTRQWATALIERLGIPTAFLAPLIESGRSIGAVQAGVCAALVGTPVIAPAAHDTGSAVAAIEARNDTAFLSSGTWSLLGIELDAPILNEKARIRNFTNEGGVAGTTRFLKNVMGLWMIQESRKSLRRRGRQFEYHEMQELVMDSVPLQHLVNPDDKRFMKPECMLTAIDAFCRQTDQPTPQTPGAYIRCVLESLALKYRLVLRHLEELTDRQIRHIRVIGGGSKNRLLNQFTADATQCRVTAGPAEATALGNIAVQLLSIGATRSLSESREMIEHSFQPDLFVPQPIEAWERHTRRFEQYCEATDE